MEEQKLYWGMHFCNSRMFKTIVKVEMYIREQQAEGITPGTYRRTYKVLYDRAWADFKFDKTEFVSYELDSQNMVWFQNQDFVRMYFDEYMKYTEMDTFLDCYKCRGEM